MKIEDNQNVQETEFTKDLYRTKSYSEATLRRRNPEIHSLINELAESTENNKNKDKDSINTESTNNSRSTNKKDDDELTPLQEECKTFITVVERLYSLAFLIGFLSLCLVMILARYN